MIGRGVGSLGDPLGEAAAGVMESTGMEGGGGHESRWRSPKIVAMKPQPQVQTAYDGRLFKVQVLTWTDEHGRQVTREIVQHPGAVMVIPALDERTVVMIRNQRIAVKETLWEFPAGKLESGEKPLNAAHRELEEETGFRAAAMQRLGEFYTSPGFASELMHAFVAEDLTFIGQRLEAGEDIDCANVPIVEVFAMIRDGRLRDGKSIAGFLMWRSANNRCESLLPAAEPGAKDFERFAAVKSLAPGSAGGSQPKSQAVAGGSA
jgi:ADP-ribose pyrophosphatase